MSAHRTNGDAQPAFRPLESITILGILGILGLALGLFALMRPSTVAKQHKVSYTQSGTFNYSASASTNSIYGPKGVTTGEPIVIKLVGPVHFGFDYRLSAALPSQVHGTAGLVAKVDVGSGLSKTFPIAAAQPFTGNHASVSGTLPLTAIKSYIDAAGRDLGSLAANTTVSVLPQIDISGSVGGRALGETTYAPALPLTFAGSTLAIASSTASDASSSTATGATSSTGADDALKPSATGSIDYDASTPNTVPLVFLHPSVAEARIIGIGVAGLCLLLCLWSARPLRAGRSPGDRDRIRALYGAQLVPVEAVTAHAGPVADVASMEALADLAKRYDAVIMHVETDKADTYAVWDNGILYRYTSLVGEQDPAVKEMGAATPSQAFSLDLWTNDEDAIGAGLAFSTDAEHGRAVTEPNRSRKKRTAQSARDRRLEPNGARGQR